MASTICQLWLVGTWKLIGFLSISSSSMCADVVSLNNMEGKGICCPASSVRILTNMIVVHVSAAC